MNSRITGQQARELLDGTTPAPWGLVEYEHDLRSIGQICGVSESGQGDSYLMCSDEDAELAAAAPALAETVAWLYGREPDTHHRDNGTWWDTHEYFISQGVLGITLFDGSGESRTLDAEQATDLARALLNAAERMESPT